MNLCKKKNVYRQNDSQNYIFSYTHICITNNIIHIIHVSNQIYHNENDISDLLSALCE